MNKMYLNTNGLMSEGDAKEMAKQVPDHDVMVHILRLLENDMSRVKELLAELCRELFEHGGD
jgi:hypothetical protein